MGILWYFIVVLICISLITNDVFMGLFAFSISFLIKRSFHLKNWVVCIFIALWEYFTYSGRKFFVRNVFGKYFFPNLWHSKNRILNWFRLMLCVTFKVQSFKLVQAMVSVLYKKSLFNQWFCFLIKYLIQCIFNLFWDVLLSLLELKYFQKTIKWQ